MADMWVMPRCIRASLIGAGSRVLTDMPILGKQMRREMCIRDSLVGVGVLSLQMCGSGSDSTARRGLAWMLKNTNQPFNWKATNTSSNLYQHYYGVQALSLIHI